MKITNPTKYLVNLWRRTPSHFFVLSILFTAVYIKVAEINSVATTSSLATFDADPPFKFRFILALILNFFFSPQQLNSKSLHFLITIFSILLIFNQQQRFTKKLCRNASTETNETTISLALFSILLAHYCIPRSLNFYYIYDIPAILFYFYTFNAITESAPPSLYSPIIILIGFLNRETLVIALLHATAFNWCNFDKKIFKNRLLFSLLILAAFGAMRLAENHFLGNRISDNASTVEGEQIRFLANLSHLKHDGNYRIQLLLLGCGITLWLPIIYKTLSPTLKGMCISTLPALAIFLWTGNFTELRIYNEFVPLICVLFSAYLSRNCILKKTPKQ